MKLRNIYISAILAASVILPLSANAFQMSSQGNSVNSSVNSGLIAQAETNSTESEGKRGRGGGKMKKMLEQLNLTTEQQEQIKSIREKYKEGNQGLRQQIREAKKEMQSLMASEASDNDLRAKHKSIQGLKQQMGEKRFDMMLEIRQVLTQEQRQKLAEMKQQRWERRSSRRGRRG
ncbi:MAG: Spy/CpxP family protein refolding chaperone [Cyanobacteria bacterium P01_A01_bin.84]